MFLLVSSWQNETSLMLVPLENIVWPACENIHYPSNTRGMQNVFGQCCVICATVTHVLLEYDFTFSPVLPLTFYLNVLHVYISNLLICCMPFFILWCCIASFLLFPSL